MKTLYHENLFNANQQIKNQKQGQNKISNEQGNITMHFGQDKLTT